MPWKECDITMMREEFVKRALSGQSTKAALCREYNISRPTGDKWIKRYLSGEPLSDRSKAPFKTVNKTAADKEKLILDYRSAHPAIGAVKILRILQNQGHKDLPCSSTVNAILKRNGCISKEASENASRNLSFQRDNPNEMWQSDYKGYITLGNNKKCYPLNVLDDCSRFCLCCEAMHGETFAETKTVFTRLFQEYGQPMSLLCDNGNPWGNAQCVGYTGFEVWLMEHGILTVHGRARHPQTQGKQERFNGSLNRELLKYCELADFREAQQQFDRYRNFYNNERPHHALELEVPAKVYRKSGRQYNPKVSEWEYPNDFIVRKVKSSGYMTFRNQGYFLSEALGEKTIALKETETDGCYDVYFRQFKIAQIDITERKFKFRRIYLSENDPRFLNR